MIQRAAVVMLFRGVVSQTCFQTPAEGKNCELGRIVNVREALNSLRPFNSFNS